jgi:hypothetical protein
LIERRASKAVASDTLSSAMVLIRMPVSFALFSPSRRLSSSTIWGSMSLG